MAQNSVSFGADFSPVIQMIGAGLAMTDSLTPGAEYLDTIINTSFEKADEEFNLEAAAMATSGAINIKHMFEWGTLGVNRGRTNARPQPGSERARLWKTEMFGGPTNKVITFAFKPSVAYVPKPTARDTGMSSEVIARMRDHVFTWKAQIMETGSVVHIAPDEAKFLLIPYYEGAIGWRPNDIKRGYKLLMYAVNLTPGAKVAGNFTNFWWQFWDGRGNEMMNKMVQEQIEADFYPELTGGKPHMARPAKTISVEMEIEKNRKAVAKKAKSKAKARELDG